MRYVGRLGRRAPEQTAAVWIARGASGRARARGVIAVAVLAVMIAVIAAPASATIRVTSTDGALVASFPRVDCRVDRAGFHANKVARGWRVVMRIHRFAGFHLYPLEYGHREAGAYFILTPPGGARAFSNSVEPQTDIRRLILGGSITLPGGKRTLRLAFPITYDTGGADTHIVRVLGSAACSYPRR